MLILITVLMLNVWAISADEVLSPNINIHEELGKIKTMETKMKSLETEMERLRAENTALETQLRDEMNKKNEDREIAFSAGLTQSNKEYIGPFTTEITLTYRNVFTNIGNAYNPITGVFTAPLKGAYMFTFSVCGHAPTAAGASIYKNEQRVVIAYQYQPQNELNSSNGVVLILEVGDVVYVRLWPNTRIYGDQNNPSTFRGFLLFPLR
ncbi:hypothetical protein ABG768_021860 [Culter alburnus]|uniref:C1q domain-containing protein n=1 Tax=Culter alburnus TaxID=194366 RepID=A0AAW2ASB6_CULAL